MDYAVDAKHLDLAQWLRAQGAVSGDGPLSERHLSDWQARGWEGTSTGTRWWTTSWGSRGSEAWSSSSGAQGSGYGAKGSGAKGSR